MENEVIFTLGQVNTGPSSQRQNTQESGNSRYTNSIPNNDSYKKGYISINNNRKAGYSNSVDKLGNKIKETKKPKKQIDSTEIILDRNFNLSFPPNFKFFLKLFKSLKKYFFRFPEIKFSKSLQFDCISLKRYFLNL